MENKTQDRATEYAQRRVDRIIESARCDGSAAAFGDLQVYELHKMRIAQVCVSSEMYEDGIKRLAEELRI